MVICINTFTKQKNDLCTLKLISLLKYANNFHCHLNLYILILLNPPIHFIAQAQVSSCSFFNLFCTCVNFNQSQLCLDLLHCVSLASSSALKPVRVNASQELALPAGTGSDGSA